MAKIGASIIVMCCKAPPASWNSSAMPRGFGAASGASGSPPPSEKRATTGMVLPEKSAERLRAAASVVPTNWPAAQVPLVWFLRWPWCTPKSPSKASSICGAVTSVLAACAPEPNMAVLDAADPRIRNANRAPQWREYDFILGDPSMDTS